MSHSFTQAVADYFKARPGQWVSAYDLMQVGGTLAFRTRVSECRRQLGMSIENKVERRADGLASSFYRYLPPTPKEQPSLMQLMEAS